MLRESLFVKLLTSFLLIALVAVSTISVSLYLLVENYLYKAKEHELVLKSRQVAALLTDELKQNHDPQATIQLLQWPDSVVDTHIMVLDSLGKIIANSDKSYPIGGLASKNILEAARGKPVVTQEENRTQTLSVGTPIKIGEKVAGAVVMYSPIVGIDSTIGQMQKLIFSGALIAIAFASITAVLLSNAVSQPILSMSAHALQLAAGKFEHRVEEVGQDEVGQLAKTLNYMASELEKQNEAKIFQEEKRREFVANVSHELRSPLTSINGYVEALLDGKAKDASAVNKYLQVIHKEGKRMDRLINELLILSGLQAGKVELELEILCLRPLIGQVVQQMEPLILDNNLRVSMKIREDGPVLIDSDKIKQVLINLLSNAIKFTPQGGSIEISSKYHDLGVLVSVSDTGSGIPANELTLVWDRFHKVDKARTPATGGTGLGLAISKEVVTQHNGYVLAESEYKKGSIFSFWLPIYTEQK